MNCKYFKTEDNRIVDLEKTIEEQKQNDNYTDYCFEELENDEQGQAVLKFSAVGTERCSMKYQVGKRCEFVMTCDSPSIAQSNSLMDLIDGFIVVDKHNEKHWFFSSVEEVNNMPKEDLVYSLNDWDYHGFLQTNKGFVYVTEMNENGELKLLCQKK